MDAAPTAGDINATPVDALLMPSVQSKQDMPQLQTPSYEELLRAVDTPKLPAPSKVQAQLNANPNPPQQPHPPPPYHHHRKPRQRYADFEYDFDGEEETFRDRPTRKQKLSNLAHFLKDNKASVFVGVVVAVLLLYGVPKLQAAAPWLAQFPGSVTGCGLNVRGILAVSAAAAVLHGVGLSYIA